MRAWLKDWWPLLAGITAVMAAIAGGAWRISAGIAALETGLRAELAGLGIEVAPKAADEGR